MNDYPCSTTSELPLHVLLRRRRLELKMLQSDVAEALSVSPEAVVLWEAGRRRMELSRLPRIAAALKLDPKDICIRALSEYHPVFCAALFGPRNQTPTAVSPAA